MLNPGPYTTFNNISPCYAGVVKYGERQPPGWMPRGVELVELFVAHITKKAPKGANPSERKKRIRESICAKKSGMDQEDALKNS